MAGAELSSYHDSCDPLWRLAPTPLNLRICIGRLAVLVESNDHKLLANLAEMNAEKSSNAGSTFLWRIIRDPETGGEIEPVTLIVDGDLSFLKMGTGVFAGVDKERKELLGFVGTGVSECAFQESVAPLFVQLTMEAVRDGAHNPTAKMELALARGNANA
jgi:hypothetical protein